ncbi:MAG: tyrosine--tRNA ligase [Acidobacteriota bacterium]|nr:tyrosine--tRNA ligase [Acidobacteriota bacterium]
MTTNLLEELEWRGMLFDKTEGAEEMFASEEIVTAYIGFDPTASSLHVGNLLAIMGLVHLQKAGHRPIALVGGATGMIGDPSGKSRERNLLTREKLDYHVSCIREQLSRFLDFDDSPTGALLVNNADWIGPMSFIDFMRDVGKNFSVAAMMNKESVKRRISETGISFTEFSYMVLQAYDFFHLNKTYGCTLQMGGSDQWGNITAGTDLIRRLGDGEGGGKAQGIVFPLVTTSTGQKLGKTEEGAIWLDAEQTSAYKFYQYWINTSDVDALRWLKIFTTLPREEIEELAAKQAEAPQARDVQKRLAEDVTRRVHGDDALAGAIKASRALFGGDLSALSGKAIGEVFEDTPSTELPKERFEGEGFPILNLFTECGLTKSNGEARRLCQGNGVNLNNQRVSDVKKTVTLSDAIEGKYIVLRKGKKAYHLVKLLP